VPSVSSEKPRPAGQLSWKWANVRGRKESARTALESILAVGEIDVGVDVAGVDVAGGQKKVFVKLGERT
jgi:hypothetical protein